MNNPSFLKAYLIVMVSSSLILVGCSTYGTLNTKRLPVLGFMPNEILSASELAERASGNIERVKVYESERPYRNGGEYPARCLALSGGGQRAAAYAIGVMRALAEHDQLDTFDIISSVSGGAYASAWYYTQLYYEPEQPASRAFFSSERKGPLDHSFLKEGQIIGDAWNGLWIAPLTIYGLTTNWFVDSFLGTPPGTLALFRLAYRDRLAPYFRHPKKTDKNLSPTMGQIRDMIRNRNLPMPIINATIQDNETNRVRAHGQVYEVTPFHVGSDHTAYTRVNSDLSLASMVAISGSAPDQPTEYGLLRRIRISSGTVLGKTIWADNNPLTIQRPFYFLSDGGHSENLGAYSVVQRGCQNLIIVDGEEEPDRKYLFEAYLILKTLVRHQLNMDLAIGSIDRYLDRLSKRQEPSQKWPEPATSWPEARMTGKIESLPLLRDSEPPSLVTQVPITYLKLSFDYCSLPEQDRLGIDVLNCPASTPDVEVSQYYTPILMKVAVRDSRVFPMYSTLNQWLDSDQQHALADLGYAHMKATLCRTNVCAGGSPISEPTGGPENGDILHF